MWKQRLTEWSVGYPVLLTKDKTGCLRYMTQTLLFVRIADSLVQ